MRRRSLRTVALAAALLVMTVGDALDLPVESAPLTTTVELVMNGNFDAGNTNEWQKSGAGALSADGAQAYSPGFSMALTPSSGQLTARQTLDMGGVVGRSLTISGWIYSTINRGANVLVVFNVPGGVDTSSCLITVPSSIGSWTAFTTSCVAPASIYWSTVLAITTGTTGTVYLDDLSVVATGAGPGFSITKQPASFGAVPADAAIIMLSTRHHTNGNDGFVHPQIYVMNAAGASVSRITNDGWGYTHAAISSDRKLIVAGRFWEDFPIGGSPNNHYDELQDPQSLWVLDLEHGEQWQLLPSWYWTGMGGVVFSPDDQWIYFGQLSGPYAQIYKIRPDGSDLALISPNADWGSDVGVSADGEWLNYHHVVRNPDGTYANKGDISVMRVDGSEDRQVTDGGPGAPGSQGGWAIGDYDAEFSPDGQQLVFAYNNPATQGWGITRVNLDGTGRVNLVNGSPTQINGIPDWHEQGVILFSRWSGSYYGGVTMDPDGANLHQIENGLPVTDGGVWVRWFRPNGPPPSVGGIVVAPDVAALSNSSSDSNRIAVVGAAAGIALVMALAITFWNKRAGSQLL
jgi:Tol biopolymer transport system component